MEDGGYIVEDISDSIPDTDTVRTQYEYGKGIAILT